MIARLVCALRGHWWSVTYDRGVRTAECSRCGVVVAR